MTLQDTQLVEYNEIIGQLYTEKIMLEEKIEDMRASKIEEYEYKIADLNKSNRELMNKISELVAHSPHSDDSESEKINALSKRLEDMSAKKDMYRNERYELRRQIKVLNRKIDRLVRE